MYHWHSPSCRTTTSSQHVRPSGVLRCRSDGLECAAWRPPRPVAQRRQFQQDAKDASVLECTWTLSALEALRNALYKFKTYLLTIYASLIWLPNGTPGVSTSFTLVNRMPIRHECVMDFANTWQTSVNNTKHSINNRESLQFLTSQTDLLLLVCVSLTIIGQPRNSVLIHRVQPR